MQQFKNILFTLIALLAISIQPTLTMRDQNLANKRNQMQQRLQNKQAPQEQTIQTNEQQIPKQKLDKQSINLGLLQASSYGIADLANAFIKSGADVNYKDETNNTPLHYASNCQCNIEEPSPDANKHYDVIKLLLEHKANVNAKNKQQWTPLHVASEFGCLEAIKLLIAAKANKDAKNSDGGTPLYIACQNNHPNVVAFLCSSGADINSATIDNSTPLHAACQDGYFEIAKILLNHKANTKTKDKNLKTPLHIAAWNGFLDIVNLLIINKANVKVEDKNKWTPLHCAIANDYPKIVEALLKHGADVNAETTEGITPIHLAFWKQNPAVIDLLIKYGAYVISDEQAEEDEREFLAQLNQEEPQINITSIASENKKEQRKEKIQPVLTIKISEEESPAEKPVVILEEQPSIQLTQPEVQETEKTPSTSKLTSKLTSKPTPKLSKGTTKRTQKPSQRKDYRSEAKTIISEKTSSPSSETHKYKIMPFAWAKFFKTNQVSATQRKAINQHIKQLENWGQTAGLDIEKLKGEKDTFRIRIGEYRATFFVDKKNSEITILEITLRGDAYKK